VERIINHPFFNRITFDYDVAVLKLKTPIQIDDLFKQEIEMPYQGEILPETTAVLVSGWGE
jgi:Trypsin